jgi:hypothetical protein
MKWSLPSMLPIYYASQPAISCTHAILITAVEIIHFLVSHSFFYDLSRTFSPSCIEWKMCYNSHTSSLVVGATCPSRWLWIDLMILCLCSYYTFCWGLMDGLYDVYDAVLPWDDATFWNLFTLCNARGGITQCSGWNHTQGLLFNV